MIIAVIGNTLELETGFLAKILALILKQLLFFGVG